MCVKLFVLILSTGATMDARLEGYDVGIQQPDLSYRIGEAEFAFLHNFSP